MEKAKYCVYTTKNYGRFKQLIGNRTVHDARVNLIKKSIQKVGWIPNPIICNENYEIADGQGRFSALKELGLPIEFIIAPGIGIEECRAMNINQKNWAIGDWIDSYAELGNENYIYLRNLLKQFKRLGLTTATCAVNGGAFTSSPVISRGDFVCSKEQYEAAVDALTFTDKLLPYVAEINGRKDILNGAIVFIYMNEDIDMDRFERVFKENFRLMPPVATLESSLLALESIYNKRNRGKLANFANDYKAFARDKGVRYAGERSYSDYARRHYIGEKE